MKHLDVYLEKIEVLAILTNEVIVFVLIAEKNCKSARSKMYNIEIS